MTQSPTPNYNDILSEFIEKGADLEHDRWARWQKYFFSKCLLKPQSEVNGLDDRFIYFALSKDLYTRWNKQIETSYQDLSEEEKESDRKETRNYIPIIQQALTLATERAVMKENKAWLDGERCTTCGNEMKQDGLTDTCEQCFRDN